MAVLRVEEAISRVKDGSVGAYEEVVNAYQGRLRAVLSSFCPPGIDGDEIAHRAFVEAFNKIDEYRPGTNFFAWLASIGRAMLLAELRRIRNETRKHTRYLQHVVSEAVESQLEAPGLRDEDLVNQLRDCLARLPDRQRTIVEMRYAGDTRLATIAERIGSTVAAVKFQLFEARRRLRNCVSRKQAAQKV